MLSHLEMTHALERMMRRSGLPFALSQGFSPHMKMGFGPALPVGVGGTEEVFEVVLTDYVAPEKAFDALVAVAPLDMCPQSCAYVETHGQAAAVAFAQSTYEVTLSAPLMRLCVPEQIVVAKKGKEKVLCPEEFLCARPVLAEDGLAFTFTLQAKESGSMRADVFARACIAASVGQQPDAEAVHAVPDIVSFVRTALV